MLLDQQHQNDISPITPLATDRVDDTSTNNTASAETVVWYFLDTGAWGAAGGEAAGTICAAKLDYTGVNNALGSSIGNYYDTSLSFAAATRAKTLVEVPEEVFSKMESMSVTNKIAKITPFLDTAGDYAIDHRRGQIWLNSLAIVANDAATYIYQTPLSGGGTGDKIDLIKIGGTNVGSSNPLFVSGAATADSGAASSAFRSTAVDETAAGVAVKASAGNVYGWNFYNPNAYSVFVKFYNTAQGGAVVGTAAVVETVQVPSLGSVVIKQDTPIKSFSTAITIGATQLVADADVTAIASNIFAHIYYK